MMKPAIPREGVFSDDSSQVLWGKGLPAWPQRKSVAEAIALARGLSFSGGPNLSPVPSPQAEEEVSPKFVCWKEFPYGVLFLEEGEGGESGRIKTPFTAARPSHLPEEAGDTAFKYSSHQSHFPAFHYFLMRNVIKGMPSSAAK